MTKVALNGLGVMGAGMAGRLLAAGFDLTVYNRNPERAESLRQAGAKVAATPADAAAGAEFVITMVADDAASRDVWLGHSGALAAAPKGAILIDCSTLSPAWIRELAARAEETEYDPAKVSDSLKAVFQFGSAATKQALNANTVTLISGTIGGTYVQFGADLASVLDDGNRLRVLPIVGRGSVQSVADILFLQGVDLGIVRADTLDYLEKKGIAKDIKKQFSYVTKLYN